MSAAKPLDIVRRVHLPIGHLRFELTEAKCGTRQWCLVQVQPEDLGGARRMLVNGFLDGDVPAELGAELEAAAQALRAFTA